MPDERREEDPRDAVEALVEEYFEGRRRGDRSDVDEFARRVPGRADEFRRLVRALEVLEVAGAAATPPAKRERLGRFRLLRLAGRGGMGAVYEAVDEELGRHVALKVLPGHATLDERELARFQREAQSAARLNHPHIVPLFGVGEDAGTHWLAMQFIEGESFDRVLQRMAGAGGPRFAAADVARHGLAIAEALACAHAEGVLHRDVKPSNLLLDRSGTVWITDFGLAKSEGAASITRTGESVGTPRYMAPEAFSGWADPRTDVWGVGATLYEMLAGRPAFDGRGRAELLKQIHDVEPVPLRRVDPKIPRDLATILHKCLQKEPAARYTTASELADDLRRFLASEPIRARPPSLAYRVGLIGRRHPTATGLLVVALTGGVVMTLREATRARAAEKRAQGRFDDVRRLAGSFLFEFHDAIRNLPGSTAARALIVQRGLEYIDRLAAESAGDPGLRRELAAAYQRIGDVQGAPFQPNLGDMAGARKSYQASIGLLEPVVVSGTASDEDRALLANAFLVTGGIELASGDSKRAIAISERGLELRKAIAAGDPSPARRQELASAWQYLAYSLGGAGRADDAIHALDEQAALLRELLATTPDDPALLRGRGQNLYLMGVRRRERQELAEARTCFDEAIAVQRRLVAAHPGDTSLRRDLVWTLTDQAILFERKEQYADSLARHQEALALNSALEAADPESRDARVAVAMSQNNVGTTLNTLKRPEEALAHLEAAIERCETLSAADPSNAFVEGLLAVADLNAAIANEAFGDPASLETACDLYRKSIDIVERMEAGNRLPFHLKQMLAKVRACLATCEARTGR
jgi:tetratricopeptide (TPR) repeat protein